MPPSSEFNPTPDHERFRAATEALGWNESLAGRCRLAELREKKARTWMKDQAFVAWLRAAYWKAMAEAVTSVWASILKSAQGGSSRAAHMFLTRFDPDYVPSERQARLKDKRADREAVVRLLELAAENGIPCEKAET